MDVRRGLLLFSLFSSFSPPATTTSSWTRRAARTRTARAACSARTSRCVPAETQVLRGRDRRQPDPPARRRSPRRFGELDAPEVEADGHAAQHRQLHADPLRGRDGRRGRARRSPATCARRASRSRSSRAASASCRSPSRANGVGALRRPAWSSSATTASSPSCGCPLHASFIGVPELRVTPNPVDFGYVAQGRVGKKPVQITNQGTGVAEVDVNRSAWCRPTRTTSRSWTRRPRPVELKPVSADEASCSASRCSTTRAAPPAHARSWSCMTTPGRGPGAAARATRETPPQLAVQPARRSTWARCRSGTPTCCRSPSLNEGGAPLEVSTSGAGQTPTTDLFATPAGHPAHRRRRLPRAAGGGDRHRARAHQRPARARHQRSRASRRVTIPVTRDRHRRARARRS